MKKKQRVVVTGIGPLTAAGSGKDEVWKAILDKKTGLIRREYKINGESLGEYYVHEIKDFNIDRYGIDKSVLDEIKSWKMGEEIIDLQYFLATIKMAVDDARLKINEKTRNTIGLMLAHENIGLDHFYWKVINELSFVREGDIDKPKTKKGFLGKFYEKFHRTGYELQTFMSLHHIAKAFDIHGYSLFMNNACASGLYALEAAKDAIVSGKCTAMIVAAVDHASIFKQMWFSDVNCLAKDGRIKPFASDRDGFTIGEGGAAILLEDMEYARKRKANIYAEYLGGSFVLEGWKITYPDVSNDLYKRMILDALRVSGVKASDVDLLVPHGVATNITDKYEAKAIREIFGKQNKKLIVTALKPYFGHTLGSTALLETATGLMAMKNNSIPSTLNCENLDNKVGINLLRSDRKATVKSFLKTACGFAGYNGACVFGKI